jgi:BON domain
LVANDDLKNWWTNALLGEQISAHPIFGADIEIDIDGSVVTLTGEVETAEHADELVAQAEGLQLVETVVNHLTVVPDDSPTHLQTVIAIFPDVETARLACQAIVSWKLSDERNSDVIDTPEEAHRQLAEHARCAGVEEKDIQHYVDSVKEGKVLLVDRVPEDDAFRVISALEGTAAENIRTLPPEPEVDVQR